MGADGARVRPTPVSIARPTHARRPPRPPPLLRYNFCAGCVTVKSSKIAVRLGHFAKRRFCAEPWQCHHFFLYFSGTAVWVYTRDLFQTAKECLRPPGGGTSPHAHQTPQEQAQFDQQSPEKVEVESQVATQLLMQRRRPPRATDGRIRPSDQEPPTARTLL